jgi:hypothetical protein
MASSDQENHKGHISTHLPNTYIHSYNGQSMHWCAYVCMYVSFGHLRMHSAVNDHIQNCTNIFNE